MARKLDFDDAQVIRHMARKGRSVAAIALEYKVNPTTIYSVLKGFSHRPEDQKSIQWAPADAGGAARAATNNAREGTFRLEDVVSPEVAALMRGTLAQEQSRPDERLEEGDVVERMMKEIARERKKGSEGETGN